MAIAMLALMLHAVVIFPHLASFGWRERLTSGKRAVPTKENFHNLFRAVPPLGRQAARRPDGRTPFLECVCTNICMHADTDRQEDTIATAVRWRRESSFLRSYIRADGRKGEEEGEAGCRTEGETM